jgi:hypothetical protein
MFSKRTVDWGDGGPKVDYPVVGERRTIDWQNSRLQRAWLDVLAAIEEQNIILDDIEVVVKYKTAPKPPKRKVGQLYGSVTIYEQEV